MKYFILGLLFLFLGACSNAPETIDYGSLEINLTRTGCYGSCSAYSVTVDGQGSVEFYGFGDVAALGYYKYKVPHKNVERIIEKAHEIGYWNLVDEYKLDATDAQTKIINIGDKNSNKQVVDYLGERAGMPASVSEFQNFIDEQLEVNKFIDANQFMAFADSNVNKETQKQLKLTYFYYLRDDHISKADDEKILISLLSSIESIDGIIDISLSNTIEVKVVDGCDFSLKRARELKFKKLEDSVIKMCK